MDAGLWMLGGALGLVVVVVLGRRTARDFWFGLEDPRAIAAFRIAFTLVAICNVNGLAEYFLFLFSDEGVLPAAVARQAVAAGQFAGYGEGVGEPVGFFDLAAFGRYVSGPKFSLLFFWDHPAAVWANVVVFELAALMLLVGWHTRISAAICFAAMISLFDRNPLFAEGTDVVIRVFFVYLLFARSGHAWSVDNWLRCRRLAARASSEHPHGRKPIYRPIPAWPRRLMMLQLAAVYVTTGMLKNGAVWARGDAVYYALNLDHFWRVPPQAVTAVLGTNVLRVATWFVRFGEIAFGLVFVGAVLRVHDESRPPPARWPKVVAVTRWLRAWVLGRRIWITWAAVTMGGIFVLMNIGQFQPVMLVLCLVYFRGEEIERLLARVRRRPPAEGPDLARYPRPAEVLPWWAIAAAGVLGVVALGLAARGGPASRVAWAAVAFVAGVYTYRRATGRRPAALRGRGWAYGSAGRCALGLALAWHVVAVGVWLMPKVESIGEERKRVRAWVRPWITTTRTSQGWGMFAPNPPRRNDFLQVLVTGTDGQVWDMNSDVYAPARRTIPFIWNDRMRKMNRRMIGAEGKRGGWYRKWYARWQCRDFALRHDGAVPEKVQLVHLSYRIPTPEQMATKGWYRPADRLRRYGKRKVIHTEHCARSVLGQPSDEVAARYGVVSSVPHRPWVKRRLTRWKARK